MDTTQIADTYRRLAERFTDTVAQVPADRWDDQSPCEGWTARDVVGHVVETQSFPLTPAGLTLPPGPDVAADPLAAWAVARDAVLEILDDPERAGLEYDSQMGRTTVAETFGSFMAFDQVIHRWDLARATGLDETIPAEDLAIASGLVERMGEMIRTPGVCGPAVEVPGGADEQARVLGLLGRTP